MNGLDLSFFRDYLNHPQVQTIVDSDKKCPDEICRGHRLVIRKEDDSVSPKADYDV